MFFLSLSQVNDIHAVLEVTVLDEDKNKVYEYKKVSNKKKDF